jgi:hypothetical protein
MPQWVLRLFQRYPQSENLAALRQRERLLTKALTALAGEEPLSAEAIDKPSQDPELLARIKFAKASLLLLPPVSLGNG